MKSGVQILFKFKKKQETDKAKTKNQIIELLSNRIIIMGVLLTALFCLLYNFVWQNYGINRNSLSNKVK